MTDNRDIFRVSDQVTIVPVIHGSGDCTLAVRRLLLDRHFDCLAVPLPPSIQGPVERGIACLPRISVVVEPPPGPGSSETDTAGHATACSFTPIEPCQPVIGAVRLAMGEHIHRAFIDPEWPAHADGRLVMPDPYALKRMSLDRFAATILPFLPRPVRPDRIARLQWLASQLHRLEQQFSSIILVCAIADWPWVRYWYQQAAGSPPATRPDAPGPAKLYHPAHESLLFLLGELPFITQLHVARQRNLEDDTDVSVDGIKELLLASRASYKREFRRLARPMPPQALALCLKYIRNLTLLDRRLTPDFYTVVVAAKQVLGDSFALHVVKTARQYRDHPLAAKAPLTMSIDRARLPSGHVVSMVSRLPGPPISWRTVELRGQGDLSHQRRWQMQWNPFSQCSWPPEDDKIEQFRTHLVDRARALLGDDLARSEKFTTSLKDGIDLRESLRHWHTGELYVKSIPPSRGPLDAVVMLFDSPADPRDYPWRTTWFAEHEQESTLAFFATDFRDNLVGPGIAMAQYGGALFLFPPRGITQVWEDPTLDFTETLEERLLAAACLHSRARHVALLAPLPPGAGWRRLARRYQKKLVHLPLRRFANSTIAQLRMVHVLNGHSVRSYAADFIRRA